MKKNKFGGTKTGVVLPRLDRVLPGPRALFIRVAKFKWRAVILILRLQ
jgi:hypothetical protein